MLRLLSVIKVLAALIGIMVHVDMATPDNQHQQGANTPLTQRQQSVNRVLMILDVVTCGMQELFDGI